MKPVHDIICSRQLFKRVKWPDIDMTGEAEEWHIEELNEFKS